MKRAIAQEEGEPQANAMLLRLYSPVLCHGRVIVEASTPYLFLNDASQGIPAFECQTAEPEAFSILNCD
jgi:hypothetical protein